MKSFISYLVAAIFFIISTPAFSLDLDEARSKKMVTEQPDGFIKANDPSAKQLEADINKKRREAYEAIVKENGGKLTLQQVGEQAAKKIREKTNAQ
jgi:uncharacterized protein YdbL (DUF1318 family)